MSDKQTEAANRKARELAGAAIDVNVPPPEAAGSEPEKKEVPIVRLPGDGYGDHRFQKEVGAILNRNGVFRRDRLPVVINRETGLIEPMTPRRFCTYASKHMQTAKFNFDPKTGVSTPIERTMSVEQAGKCLESDWFVDQQRPLRRVNMVPMPMIRRDGRIELLRAGYDVESRILTMPSDVTIDESMTLERARAVWIDLVKEMPFGDFKEDTEANRAAGVVGQSRSRAVHLANALSVYGAGMMPELASRLHFCYVANAQRSGKTLLAKMVVVPIFGPAAAVAKPEAEDDLKKLLTTMAVTSAPYLLLDDLDGLLKSQALNAFMTSATITDRKMGSHEQVRAMKETVVIITGNNLSLSTDIANRTLRCNLYTEEFDAQNRQINHVIDEQYLIQATVRSELLSALWCFIREWDRAGRPKGAWVLRGFEHWSELFGGVVIHAGFGDPLEAPPADDYSGDTEASDMQTLVALLVDDMESRPGSMPEEVTWTPPKKKEFEFEELVAAAQENECFTWMMEGTVKTAGDVEKATITLNQRSKSALGKMFAAKYGGRKFRLKDGRVVRFGHRGRNRHRRYKIEIVEPTK